MEEKVDLVGYKVKGYKPFLCYHRIYPTHEIEIYVNKQSQFAKGLQGATDDVLMSFEESEEAKSMGVNVLMDDKTDNDNFFRDSLRLNGFDLEKE